MYGFLSELSILFHKSLCLSLHQQNHLDDHKFGVFFVCFFFFFLALLGLSCGTRGIFVVSCGSFVLVHGLDSSVWAQYLWYAGLVAPWHVEVQFSDQGLNLHPLHCEADSQPLDHQGSPNYYICIVSFETRSCEFSNFVLFKSFWILTPLHCHRNCRISLLISTNKQKSQLGFYSELNLSHNLQSIAVLTVFQFMNIGYFSIYLDV